jgi:hypothetical protein
MNGLVHGFPPVIGLLDVYCRRFGVSCLVAGGWTIVSADVQGDWTFRMGAFFRVCRRVGRKVMYCRRREQGSPVVVQGNCSWERVGWRGLGQVAIVNVPSWGFAMLPDTAAAIG